MIPRLLFGYPEEFLFTEIGKVGQILKEYQKFVFGLVFQRNLRALGENIKQATEYSKTEKFNLEYKFSIDVFSVLIIFKAMEPN